MIAKGKQSNKLLAYQWLRVGSKNFFQRGHSRFPAQSVLPVRKHGKVARTPSCLFHPERWVICFQPTPTSQYGGLEYQMTIDRLRTYIPVPPSIDGGCLNGIIQVAPFFMAGGGGAIMPKEGRHIMRWGFQVLPHAIIVRIFGTVDHSFGEMFESATERAVKLDKRQVVIDFSDMESIDAVGLVLCGYGLHHFEQLGIPVALVKPPASLLPVLQKHGLPKVPPVFFTMESVPSLN